MILIFETGNTTINIVIYDGNEIKYKWKVLDTQIRNVEDFRSVLEHLLKINDVDGVNFEIVLISSVVRSLEAVQEEYCKKAGLKFLNIKNKKVKLNFKARETLGADLIANIFSALESYRENFIVVDMGTATTFSVVGKDGLFLGVVFVAGVNTTLKALGNGCDLLPNIEIAIPKKVIGSTTEEAMQSGIYYGYIGMLKEIVQNILVETKSNMKVILTGGYSGIFIDKLTFVTKVEPDITFDGIKKIYEYNKDILK